MRVFISGGTRTIGEAVIKELRRAGHAVTGLSRSEASDAKLRALGATPPAACSISLRAITRPPRRTTRSCTSPSTTATPSPPTAWRSRPARGRQGRQRAQGGEPKFH